MSMIVRIRAVALVRWLYQRPRGVPAMFSISALHRHTFERHRIDSGHGRHPACLSVGEKPLEHIRGPTISGYHETRWTAIGHHTRVVGEHKSFAFAHAMTGPRDTIDTIVRSVRRTRK